MKSIGSANNGLRVMIPLSRGLDDVSGIQFLEGSHRRYGSEALRQCPC